MKKNTKWSQITISTLRTLNSTPWSSFHPNLDEARIFPQLVTGLLASRGDLEAYASFHLLLTRCFPNPFLCQQPSASSSTPRAGNMSTSTKGYGRCTNCKKKKPAANSIDHCPSLKAGSCKMELEISHHNTPVDGLKPIVVHGWWMCIQSSSALSSNSQDV